MLLLAFRGKPEMWRPMEIRVQRDAGPGGGCKHPPALFSEEVSLCGMNHLPGQLQIPGIFKQIKFSNLDVLADAH